MSDTTKDDTEFRELDYVFAGRALTSKGEIGYCIIPIDLDGELGEPGTYSIKGKFTPIVGGVYRGASFSETKVRGLSEKNLYVRQWPIVADRLIWAARDQAIERGIASRRMELNVKKQGDYERILLPIRRTIAHNRKFGRWSDTEAIEAAVLRALRTPLRKSEEEQ